MIIPKGIPISMCSLVIAGGAALPVVTAGPATAKTRTAARAILRGNCCNRHRNLSSSRNFNSLRDPHRIIIINRFQISNISESGGQEQSQKLNDKKLGLSSASANAAGGGGGGGGTK